MLVRQVRIHHMEAHAMVTRLPAQGQKVISDAELEPRFPYATVLVSGGHNMVLHTSAVGVHRILGSTLDDSIGEAFDKTARLLGIDNVPGQDTHRIPARYWVGVWEWQGAQLTLDDTATPLHLPACHVIRGAAAGEAGRRWGC
jgi:hypothetical protein